MGNRAVITTKHGWASPYDSIGIYLHWNGGRDSVEAFLKYCELRRFRSPDKDDYGWSYLASVICNFFGDGMSCGIDTVSKLDCDNYDNGVYIIENWEIVGRKCHSGAEQKCHDLKEMLIEIDKAQPEKQQIGEEAINKYFEKEKEKQKVELELHLTKVVIILKMDVTIICLFFGGTMM